MATEFIIANPEKAVEIGVRYTGMDEDTIKEAMKKIKYNYYPDITGTREYLEFLIKFGYVKENDSEGFIKRFINEDLWTGF